MVQEIPTPLTGHPEFVVYHDLDGVHADIASGYVRLTGLPWEDRTNEVFWNHVDACEDFFARLDRLPDSQELYDHTAHLPHAFLTGRPLGTRAADQKRWWVAQHFGPTVEVIVVPGKLKQRYAHAHAVLIDDHGANITRWRDAGGIGILHTSAADTIAQLRELGI